VPSHLESLRTWIDLAEEVVVVDSDSRDGTLELLRAGLSHPRVKFLNHPPGLYQSWNFGIQNAGAKYIYIATAGDSITRRGVEQLFEVAEKFQSDVVISKPAFVNAAGEALPDDRWPIDVILDHLQIERPRLLSTAEQFIFAVTNLWGAILGSSASNLYRADCLKQRPFPTDYGHGGDAGWVILNIFDVKIAITPERFSTFRRHETSDFHFQSLALKLFHLAQTVVDQEKSRNPAISAILEQVHWTELAEALVVAGNEHARLEQCRRQKLPWYLNPGAWQARATRNRAEKRVSGIMDRVVAASRSPAQEAL
jgi:glycosyltransferase involved in cell wall biosynthesis